MKPNTIQHRISKSIHRKDPHAEAYLFGSRARGDHQKNSDWDILILINEDKVTNEIEDKFRDGLYDIELDSGQVVSAFIYPKTYWNQTLIYSPLYKNVSREGIRLIKATKSTPVLLLPSVAVRTSKRITIEVYINDR